MQKIHEKIINKYNVKRYISDWIGSDYQCWFSPDMLLLVEKGCINQEGIFDENLYRILPNTNDMSIVGHIPFSEHYYRDFEEAIKTMCKLI